ncbi:AAA family ATPase [Streptomyces cyaneofuscatus]|uniref:AAA family ATPase n=1 Tax=Streptomyces cyaneofuscatus TaxID=66883 RepID=UPI00364E8855
MNTFSFAPATRETARARIALQGPGGSGKTKTGLRFAEKFANGGAIGVIDTERGSALKYAPVPGRPDLGGHEFMHLPMAFCSPENLIAAVRAAEEARIAVLFVDSWSHFWAGKGGLLARVEEESKKSSNRGGKFTAWAPVNDLEQDMLDALLNFPGHVIVSMRTKNDYSMEGKNVTKVGVKTVQREGSEYEFDVVIDMIEGTGTVTKTRYEPLYNASVHHPGEDFAEVILEQLGQGVDPVQAITDELVADTLTYPRALELHARAKARNLLAADLLHPKTGKPGKLGALIEEYGVALRTQPTAPAPAPEPTQTGPAPYSASDAVAAEGAIGPNQQPASEAVTAPQSRKIFATLAGLGFDNSDRERRLRAISLIVGRQVPTQNDLTFGEAAVVIETLDGFTGDDAADRFREHLNKLLDAAREPAHA